MSEGHEPDPAGRIGLLRQLCRHLSERSPLPMVAVEGATHVVIYVNPAFARLAGGQRGDLIGRPFAQAIPEGEGNGCVALLDRVYRTGIPEDLPEQEHRHARPAPAYWSYSVWAILGEDDQPAGVMIQVTDATETALFRRQAAAVNGALLISAARQHEIADEAGSLSERLRIAVMARDHFMAVLSHELRTPLAPVAAAVSLLLRDGRLDRDVIEALEMIDRNVALEARLIDDLLDMTRIEQGRINLIRRPVDLREVILRAVEVCGPALEASGLALNLDLGETPLSADADAGRLQQVFWNLIRNSIKFSPHGGTLRIRCRREADSSAVAEVSDEGIGIDPALLPHVFEAFRQGDRDQVRRFGGLGLGLSIARAIADLHGGSISAESRGRGEGATFSVTVPIATPAASAESEQRVGVKSPVPVRPLRILLVEDHEDGARATRQLLMADGHAVEWAADVAAGLSLASSRPFDLLISDLGLPDGSGLDLMRTLRRGGSAVPGISLSGYGEPQDVEQSVEAGFAVHLTKPALRGVLEAAIRSAIEG